MANGRNGKIAGVIGLVGILIAGVVGLFELGDRMAWAKDVNRLERVIEEKIAEVCVKIAQSYKQMRSDQIDQSIMNLKIQRHQWRQILKKNPNDADARANLDDIQRDIQALEADKRALEAQR